MEDASIALARKLQADEEADSAASTNAQLFGEGGKYFDVLEYVKLNNPGLNDLTVRRLRRSALSGRRSRWRGNFWPRMPEDWEREPDDSWSILVLLDGHAEIGETVNPRSMNDFSTPCALSQ